MTGDGSDDVAVDIIIVNYRTAALTRAAVTELAGGLRRLLVWDNSNELTAAQLVGAELSSTGNNILYADASNRLYARSDAPFVLLLNSDAACSTSDLRAMVDALVADQGAWGVMPRLVDQAGADQDYRRRLPTLGMLLADRLPLGRLLLRRTWRRLYCRDLDPAVAGTVEQPAAACLLLRRSAVGAVLFDEAYPLFGNDLDLGRRMAAIGHCRYLPDVVVTHVGGASIGTVGPAGRSWLRLQYDDALRRYARRNLRGWWLLGPVFLLRRLAVRGLGGREQAADTPPP